MKRFYESGTEEIREEHGLTPSDMFDILTSVWSIDTCTPCFQKYWSPENPTAGHCTITAFLMQEIYGGKVLGIPLKNGATHCFNAVGGHVFDLTSEQFHGAALDYSAGQEQLREEHFADEAKKRRYELLRGRFLEKLPVIRPCSAVNVNRYAEIYAAAFSAEPWNDPWDTGDARTHVLELLESNQSYGLEYVYKGEIVGFILGTSMMFHYGRTFEINDLAVDPPYQKRGIATALLKKCIADMKERGIEGIHLITAADGLLPGFYAKHGFVPENRVMLMGLEL